MHIFFLRHMSSKTIGQRMNLAIFDTGPCLIPGWPSVTYSCSITPHVHSIDLTSLDATFFVESNEHILKYLKQWKR